MLLTAAAMLPALLVRCYYFAGAQLIDIALGLLFVIACDRLIQGRDFWRHDLSSLVALLILLLALPPYAHWYTLIFALAWALLVGKYAFGGLGQNIFNPAMVGYACALLALPWEFSAWQPQDAVDAISSATVLSTQADPALTSYHYSLAAALALGALPLVYYRLLALPIVFSFVLTLALCAALGQLAGWSSLGVQQHLLGGGSVLAALFVITDPVSSPSQRHKQIAYGASIALLTYAIRSWGSYPDGIAFAILIANALFL